MKSAPITRLIAELLSEVESKSKTIEALRAQVDYWKNLFNSLARDNEECDAELMKEEA